MAHRPRNVRLAVLLPSIRAIPVYQYSIIHITTMPTATTTHQHKDILEQFSEKFPVFDRTYSLYQQLDETGASPEDTLRKSSEITTLEFLELIVVASRQSKEAKRATLRQALTKLDTLKVFIDLARHTNGTDATVCDKISESLQNLSKMIGGWARNLAPKEADV